ncbi:MAG: hypothetical protein K2J04_02960, partial [Lachnospiraceae bacterium]|nr:hypothetical protein [Lachnospiraceae bacterium]
LELINNSSEKSMYFILYSFFKNSISSMMLFELLGRNPLSNRKQKLHLKMQPRPDKTGIHRSLALIFGIRDKE